MKNKPNYECIAFMIAMSFCAMTFCSCHRNNVIKIKLSINDKEPYSFGWAIRFDSTVVIQSLGEEIQAGTAPNGVLLAYRPAPGQDSVLECWVDKDRDSNLGNEMPCQVRLENQSEKIFVKERGSGTGTVPYLIKCYGSKLDPSILFVPHYTMDGLIHAGKDTTRFRLYDTNMDGFFKVNDARKGFNLYMESSGTDKGLYAIDEILPIINRNYLLDSLPVDGSFIKFRRTSLEPIFIGRMMPRFRMPLLSEKVLTNGDLLGNWTFLDFFGNMRFNQIEKLLMQELDYYTLNRDSVRFISVSCDLSKNREANIEQMNRLNPPWDQAFVDLNQSDVWKIFGSVKKNHMAFPLRVLVNPAGEVVAAGKEMNKILIGQIAPDFSEKGPDGKIVRLSDFQGKYVLLDFWASWCSPCIAEVPFLQQGFTANHSKGLEILSVSLDSDSLSWINGIKSNDLGWIHVSDLKGWDSKVANRYGVLSIPANVLINPGGVIIEKNLKGEDLVERLGSRLMEKRIEQDIPF
jgi:peroxiredoxin